MTEINGQKVWFERHEDDEWYDEVSITCVERYKTSGLSGDEWRFSYVAQFKRKGVVVHTNSWSTFKSAVIGLGGEMLKASDRPLGIEWEDKTGEEAHEWCAQPGCKAKWTVLYKRSRTFVEGYDITAQRSDSLGVPVIGFCEAHRRRGDCGLNDSDSNYEIITTRLEGARRD